MLQQQRLCRRGVERRGRDRRDRSGSGTDDGAEPVRLLVRDQDLTGFDPEQFVAGCVGPGGAEFHHPEFRCGQIQPGESRSGRSRRDCRQVVWLAGGQEVRLDQRARCEHAHDLASHEALGGLRIFDLIADGHRTAGLQEPGDIAGGGMIGDAAQRHLIGLVLVPRGQRDLEQARTCDRVLVEHFVEVPDAEEEDGVRILLLDLAVLPHERREVRWHPHPQRSRAPAPAGERPESPAWRGAGPVLPPRDGGPCGSVAAACAA